MIKKIIATVTGMCFLATVCPAQDTTKAVAAPPVAKPGSYLAPPYFRLLSMPLKLDLPAGPLSPTDEGTDRALLRRTLAIHRMGEQVTGTLREEQQGMQVNAALSIAVPSLIWGMIIKENIDGYLNDRELQRQTQQAPPPPSARPPELRQP